MRNKEIKTCLWCKNPCEKYFKEIAPAASKMFGTDAENLRVQTAHECENYKVSPQRFFFYSNGEPLTDH